MPVAPSLRLEARPSGRIRPDLEELRRVLDGLGAPQQRFRSVLVVGTNGKGSTAAMAESVLRAHGLRTGLYTSPHLVSVEERVRVEGEVVERSRLESRLRRFDAFPDLTYFETMTAAAFTLFAESGVEAAVLEAGMGGSWDATRLAGSTIAGLTNVGSDHRTWLGPDLLAIARDKGQALAAATHAVLGAGVDPDLIDALAAPHAVAAPSLVGCEPQGGGIVRVSWSGGATTVRMPLAGAHQVDNLQLAVALCDRTVAAGWLGGVVPELVREAIESLHWPARLSVHLVDGHEVLVDCAHNLEGVGALAAHLRGLPRRYNLVFSCLDDKPVEDMAALLRPAVGAVAVCELADERAMPLARLLAAFPGSLPAADPRAALALLPGPVLAAGSLRLAGALLAGSGAEDA